MCISILSVFSSVFAAEWVDLFDGETTEGWTPRSKVIRFEVKDGALELLSKTNCWVTTDIAMRDFEAELEVLLQMSHGVDVPSLDVDSDGFVTKEELMASMEKHAHAR